MIVLMSWATLSTWWSVSVVESYFSSIGIGYMTSGNVISITLARELWMALV